MGNRQLLLHPFVSPRVLKVRIYVTTENYIVYHEYYAYVFSKRLQTHTNIPFSLRVKAYVNSIKAYEKFFYYQNCEGVHDRIYTSHKKEQE